MMTIVEIPGPLSDEQALQVRRLLEAAGGDAALGEQKRTQIDQKATGWTALLATGGAEQDGTVAPDLVGYAHVRWDPPGNEPRASAEIVRHPGHADDELGEALIHHVRNTVSDAGGGTLYVWAFGVEDPDATLPAQAGFAIQRRLLIMQTDIAQPPAVSVPEGVRIAPFRPGEDDEAFLEVNNAAFATHPEQGGWTRETLQSRVQLDWFDPQGLLMAWDGDTPLGFHWTKRHDDERGEVYVIGVHPRGQGRGLGKALLNAGIAHLHDRGAREVILYVDSSSEGAVALYESVGFQVAHSDICYADHVPAAGINS